MTTNELDAEANFHKTFEWKGKELYPFSTGRQGLALSIGVRIGAPQEDGKPLMPCPTDAHLLLYILTHTYTEIGWGHRFPSKLIANALEWADENIKDQDLAAEGELIGAVMQNSMSTRAAALADDKGPSEPSGN
jgi:hypothetical protein